MAIDRTKKGKRLKRLTLYIDGLPIVVFGHQGGSDFHGHAGARIYSPLIASLAEIGDMLGSLLLEDNTGPAENADTWIPHLVRRLNQGLELIFEYTSMSASPTTTH